MIAIFRVRIRTANQCIHFSLTGFIVNFTYYILTFWVSHAIGAGGFYAAFRANLRLANHNIKGFKDERN
jgi:hypothetical protein